MCPTCRSREMRDSQKRWSDFFVLLFKVKPVRCRQCDTRFYQWPWMRDLNGGKLLRR